MICKRFYRHTQKHTHTYPGSCEADRTIGSSIMKLPISQFRGVVRQPNGRWGVQICKNKQRLWLGSFCTEVKAAETYDLAAQALHRCHARTNFKPLSPSDSNSWQELLLLRSHTTTEVVNMLQARANAFKNSLDMECYNADADADANASGKLVMQPADHVMKRNDHHHELLLRRPISLGDIGPQTRLQIPRHHAGKYYPFGVRRGMIQFEDERGKLWRFRYTFWRGCHNFNGGWAYFVRKKRVKQGDVISFWRVTDKLGAVRLVIRCDTTKPVNVAPSTVLQRPPKPNNLLRLFGVNIDPDPNPNREPHLCLTRL